MYMDKVRVDKWLWAVRIFKSRTLAGNVVRQGKVRINGESAKPSSGITPGDRLTVQKNGFNLEYEVTKLIGKRVRLVRRKNRHRIPGERHRAAHEKEPPGDQSLQG